MGFERWINDKWRSARWRTGHPHPRYPPPRPERLPYLEVSVNKESKKRGKEYRDGRKEKHRFCLGSLTGEEGATLNYHTSKKIKHLFRVTISSKDFIEERGGNSMYVPPVVPTRNPSLLSQFNINTKTPLKGMDKDRTLSLLTPDFLPVPGPTPTRSLRVPHLSRPPPTSTVEHLPGTVPDLQT